MQEPTTENSTACLQFDLAAGAAGDAEKEQNRCVVRLRTTTWGDGRGLHTKRSLTYLWRQCVGYNFLQEDAEVVGAEQAVALITNLGQCPDGVYEVVFQNVTRDWETGYVDGWDYKMVPVSTEGKHHDHK